MILREDSSFCRTPFLPESGAVEVLTHQLLGEFSPRNLFYLGYHELDEAISRLFSIQVPSSPVDNFFTLVNDIGFETQPLLLTIGIRSSRFAPVLFWEAFHSLASDGVWLDIDMEESCKGTPLCDADFLDRDYYQPALEEITVRRLGSCRARLMQKTIPSMVSPLGKCGGWTFGILTSGPSATARQMIHDIFSRAPENIEIIICGPAPDNLPIDDRIRLIDLETPEPRGWITRKKNIIADIARYENLCIMHDRFIFPVGFFDAMQRYGNNFSILTFPQIYFADQSRNCMLRYPEYQVNLMTGGIRDTYDCKIYDSRRIYCLKYDDFSETAFCCGGVYVTKKIIWGFIGQDEALFHCEWEDVLFGHVAQRYGIPHRVNPFACFESVSPHPLALTKIDLFISSQGTLPYFTQISELHKRKAAKGISDFLPVLKTTRKDYCLRLMKRFNEMTMVNDDQFVGVDDFDKAFTLSEIWEVVTRHVSRLPIKHRDEIFQIISLLSHMVYNFPACILQTWTWEEECRRNGMNKTGHDIIAAIRTALDVGGLNLVASLAVKRFCRSLGNLRARVATTDSPKPFMDIIHYFKEVEQFYPVIFQEETLPNVNNIKSNGMTGDIHKLLAEEIHWKTIFLRHGEEILPMIFSEDRGVKS